MSRTETLTWIQDKVAETILVDTHEHLVEESRRISPLNDWLLPCDDWALLFRDYLQHDLHCAGMSGAEEKQFFNPELSAIDKFKIVSPYWERVQHTGYGQTFSVTIKELYGINSFAIENIEQLASQYHEVKKPGFYEHILKHVCRISECHVNSLERIFMETAQPLLLRQDLSIMELSRCNLTDIRNVESELGVQVSSFDDWLAAIDRYFEKFGTKAVAVKYVGAYYRALNFGHVERHVAEQSFTTLVAARSFLGSDGTHALEDYLFHYCLGKALEYRLPVKLHTGYLATNDSMPLSRVRENAVDVCRLLEAYPNIRFVLMHIGYPYQDEYLALCKQYSNAYVDLCWVWIINPVACVRFLTEFLVSVPANKILTFGGDFIVAENVVGHSVIARSGIAESVSALIDGRWIDRGAVPELITRLMQLNAEELFSKEKSI
ncbi:amidohydrolase [Mesorhizobium onobrychidis]|uniref:Amidohydrolase family protein n=1 Tax=Mesorhizobium onobrychidis TaxID=2775404 RepID=A0ABY5QYU3_9HYPH|nr:amidohydrolase [Mesorhizobium onobrychidis]UVC15359.1 amidohydrolase family protein [Mesorhizobium onobrychidis]